MSDCPRSDRLTARTHRFAVRTAMADSGVPRVAVHGAVDMATADVVLTRALHEIELYGPSLVLDLTRTSFMDSSGLHVIEALKQRTCGHGGQLVLVVATDAVRRLLEIVPPSSDIQVVGTWEQAESAFGGRASQESRTAAA